jgi:hypothetical protein
MAWGLCHADSEVCAGPTGSASDRCGGLATHCRPTTGPSAAHCSRDLLGIECSCIAIQGSNQIDARKTSRLSARRRLLPAGSGRCLVFCRANLRPPPGTPIGERTRDSNRVDSVLYFGHCGRIAFTYWVAGPSSASGCFAYKSISGCFHAHMGRRLVFSFRQSDREDGT